jgi:hypothetical protein
MKTRTIPIVARLNADGVEHSTSYIVTRARISPTARQAREPIAVIVEVAGMGRFYALADAGQRMSPQLCRTPALAELAGGGLSVGWLVPRRHDRFDVVRLFGGAPLHRAVAIDAAMPIVSILTC